MEVVEALTTLVTNNGTAIAMLVYFVWRDYKFMNVLNNTLSKLTESLDRIEHLVKK